jgi:hypothetical protein
MRSARRKCQLKKRNNVSHGDSLTGPDNLTLILRVDIDKVIVEVLYAFVSTAAIALRTLTY